MIGKASCTSPANAISWSGRAPLFTSPRHIRKKYHLGNLGYRAAIQGVLHDEPEFSELFISHLLARNARVEADLVDQLFNSSEKRLARILLLMANFGKEGQPEPVIAKLSQEALAEMIGTTRSRVSAFMNKFRKLGFIEYNGDLKVHNSLLNVILHDAPGLRRETEDA